MGDGHHTFAKDCFSYVSKRQNRFPSGYGVTFATSVPKRVCHHGLSCTICKMRKEGFNRAADALILNMYVTNRSTHLKPGAHIPAPPHGFLLSKMSFVTAWLARKH